jgi:hypothetical protein
MGRVMAVTTRTYISQRGTNLFEYSSEEGELVEEGGLHVLEGV